MGNCPDTIECVEPKLEVLTSSGQDGAIRAELSSRAGRRGTRIEEADRTWHEEVTVESDCDAWSRRTSDVSYLPDACTIGDSVFVVVEFNPRHIPADTVDELDRGSTLSSLGTVEKRHLPVFCHLISIPSSKSRSARRRDLSSSALFGL